MVTLFIPKSVLLLLFLNMPLVFFSPLLATATSDTITQSQPLVDDGKSTLISKDGNFELGFFSPGSSTNRYVGLWFKKVPVRYILWVANREKPLKDKLGTMTINKEGHLTILTQNQTLIWVANSTTNDLNLMSNPIAQLLDSGNLVLIDEKHQNPDIYLWQSFDYLSDVFLPGMKLGWDLRTGLNRRLIAWKNWDDPSPSDFICELQLHSYREIYIWQGRTKSYRSGPWNGDHFVDTPSSMKSLLYNATLVSNKDEVYYMYNRLNESTISIRVLNQTKNSLQNLMWIEEDQSWKSFGDVPRDNCGRYNLCGAYGICSTADSTLCQCLRGFEPKSPKNWDIYDWKEGCVRSEPWSCKVKGKDNFVKFGNLKLPDTTYTWVNASMTLDECRAKCWDNCSCTAYTTSDIRNGGSGCVMWFGDLLDSNQMSSDAGQDLYIRLASTDIAKHEGVDSYKIKVTAITASVLALGMLLTFLYIYKSIRKSKENTAEVPEGDMELPLYDFAVIASATQNFSDDNKLGQGGFGPVYKGTLGGGQEIAVKRLSQNSHQGVKEFKNEVILCAKLQHRNLAKVLGCCIQGEEKMLIYEYMSNKSLDSFIFGSPTQKRILNWFNRFHIIYGIARGLMYLHQDSRLRIIHRDLKASNILLDNELNPKISDFGLAKAFGKDENQENTRRVIGTYGYMAPEYAIYGLFSIKSDVFSFGVLLLEILSGIKNGAFSLTKQSVNLIGHVWRLWNEGIPLELIDKHMGESYNKLEVLRCIHIGLLCVQRHPDDRPNITSVVVMLSSDGDLPQPKEPGFLLENFSITKTANSALSINEISISQLQPR